MTEYYSSEDFAAHHGLDAGTIRGYRNRGYLPEPDVVIGVDPEKRRHYGWKRETVENWERPGRGKRTDLQT